MAQSAETAGLLDELPPLSRLAIAYAPAAARPLWAALLALDARLSRAVEAASSPLIAQLKLAWWRDRMRTSAAQWPKGEPLLAALTSFDGERAVLEALVDAWEGMVDEEPGEGAFDRLAEARGGAIAALARVLSSRADPQAIAALARQWTRPGAHTATPRLPRAPHLPRTLRPLLVLANLPRPDQAGPRAMLRIVRLGLFGR